MKIGLISRNFANNCDAIASRAVVSIADSLSEVSQILDADERRLFDYQIIVSQTMELCESWIHF